MPPVPAAGPRRVLVVSDAWEPQVNGVVRTLRATAAELQGMGRAVEVIGPDRFRTVPCPGYASIRLAVLPGRRLGRMIETSAPNALHIATEGPLGRAARAWALRHAVPFTTAFHTRFPEYVRARLGVPLRVSYAVLKRFHAAGNGMMVAAESLRRELAGRGFRDIRPWARGVDLSLFRPDAAADPAWPATLPRPVFLHVGRLAVEKNIGAFLGLDLPGSKVVVGDGPQRGALRRRHPEAHFVGALHGAALAAAYARADVLVFPSLTDTFGLVVLEALACGTPVAAHPVTGPLDVLGGRRDIGALDWGLRDACLAALCADRTACRAHAERFSWRASAELFLANLVPVEAPFTSWPARTRRPGPPRRRRCGAGHA